MKKMTVLGGAIAATLALSSAAQAVVTFNISPLSSFGTTGWLKPADNANLGTTNGARGFGYNPVTGKLILGSTTAGNAMVVLNGQTGAQEATMNLAGVSGGAKVVNQVGVADDGVIYMANLTAAASGTSPFKVYRWANEGAAPTVAYSGVPLAGVRVGDNFDVYSSSTGTRFAAGYSNSPTVTGNNTYAMFTTADGLAYTSAHISMATPIPAAGDHRLGITFLGDNQTILGVGSVGTAARVTTANVGAGTGTLVGTTNLVTGSGRLVDYIEFWGAKLLAVTDTTTSATRILDMTNPLAPVQLTAGGVTATGFSHTANGNGVGQVKWGAVNGGVATLYVMNTNNGIQAFTVAIPEPSALGLLGLAVPALARRRRA